jgi:tetrahydromethanopterin S-methyltransferase subunit A
MESKDLANIILRAESVAEYVRQVTEIDFVMLNDADKKNAIFLRSKPSGVVDKPILLLEIPLSEEIDKIIGVEKTCGILNKYLEDAKLEIITEIKKAIFQNEQGKEEDGFQEV